MSSCSAPSAADGCPSRHLQPPGFGRAQPLDTPPTHPSTHQINHLMDGLRLSPTSPKPSTNQVRHLDDGLTSRPLPTHQVRHLDDGLTPAVLSIVERCDEALEMIFDACAASPASSPTPATPCPDPAAPRHHRVTRSAAQTAPQLLARAKINSSAHPSEPLESGTPSSGSSPLLTQNRMGRKLDFRAPRLGEGVWAPRRLFCAMGGPVR